MKIAVVPNLKKEKAQVCTDDVISILEKHGCQVVLKCDLFDKNGMYCEQVDASLESCDLFIAVGGDGTIIHTAKLAASMGKPILGVNAGKLGFTAGVERNELALLANLPKGEYAEEPRCMMSVTLFSGSVERNFQVLNDAVVSGDLAKIIDYQMASGDNRGYHYRADGFILATPTGSTAYSLSAGGPVMDPGMRGMVYTPICPHSLFNRSVIFGENTKLTVEISENIRSCFLTVDGESPVPLFSEDRLVFSLSAQNARFIRLNRKDFYDSFYQKMIIPQ